MSVIGLSTETRRGSPGGSPGGSPIRSPSGSLSATSVSIDTNIDFNVIDPDSVPTTCQSIIQLAETRSKSNFLGTYRLNEMATNITTFFTGLMALDSKADLSGNDGYTAVVEYLDKVSTSQIPVLNLVSECLNEHVSADPSLLIAAKENHETSKARYENLNDPERVSYYEGWFPIRRPLRHVSLFALFGLGILCIIMAILTFLQMQGIVLLLHLPPNLQFSMPSFTQPQGQGVSYGSMALGGAVLGAAIAALGVWRGWF